MSTYLLQSQTKPIDSLNSTPVKFTAACRERQIKEINHLWQEDPIYQEMRDWVMTAQDQGMVQALSNPNDPDITGTIVVEMPDNVAAQMQSDLPGTLVLSDTPLELIQPRRITTSLREEITDEDLWHLAAIGLTTARQQEFTDTGKGVTIAVLDTGIDETHPELRGKVTGSYSLDIQRVRTLGEADPLDRSEDANGHGTHVAGLICGENVGVAPEAQLINAVLIPRSDLGVASFFSNFRVAMNFLSKQTDIDIVNISAGVSGSAYTEIMDSYLQTLRAIGILPVCAVGNEGRNITRSPGNCRSVISVGALNQSERVAAFSSSGNIVFDQHQYNVPSLVAPGEAVYSSVRNGCYEAWDGTSMAAPIVSGIAALILQRYPDITVLELADDLMNRCRSIEDDPLRQGAGLIQVRGIC